MAAIVTRVGREQSEWCAGYRLCFEGFTRLPLGVNIISDHDTISTFSGF